tara:strand:+ start:1192 stop:1443 length:252 start_codon:yes stop_codon:yes gene_type:complete
MSIDKFLKLNEDRAMQLALREDEEGNVVENERLACINTYTFIRPVCDDYVIISVNPISNETTDVNVPSIAISDEVKAIFQTAD